MRHLWHTRAEVLRLTATIADGTPRMNWIKADTVIDSGLQVPGELLCRLDLNFVRPGKDQPMPIVAGRAPDRIGLMFYSPDCDIRAGDRIRPIAGPITGTFEIRAIPDPAVGLATANHMEVQVIEVAQSLTSGFPGSTVEAVPSP